MDIADVARIALALDGVRESSAGRRPRWTLGGRVVARQLDEHSVVVRSAFADRERLVRAHPETFHVPPRFDAHMIVAVRLADADPAVVADAIHAAWVLQANH
jgi:hypothetical protein